MKAYIANNLYAFDLLVNALFGGKRHQTISARWGASPGKVWLFYWGCRALHWFDKDHCEKSRAQYERLRAQLPEGQQ